MKANLVEEVPHLAVQEQSGSAEAICHVRGEEADSTARPVSAALRAELDRRFADLEANPDVAESGEVRHRLEHAYTTSSLIGQ